MNGKYYFHLFQGCFVFVLSITTVCYNINNFSFTIPYHRTRMFANSLSWLHTPYQLEWSYRVRHSSTPDNCFPCHNILKEKEDGLKRGTRPQAQRNQASNRKSTMRCLLFYMWSVWFRLCRRYSSTPPSTYCWT